jgi:hypothetical protein
VTNLEPLARALCAHHQHLKDLTGSDIPEDQWRRFLPLAKFTVKVLGVDAMQKRIAELEARLEIEPGHPYDGIDTRDATIAGLERRITEMAHDLFKIEQISANIKKGARLTDHRVDLRS